MRRFPVIREICDAMIELGWGPYQNDGIANKRPPGKRLDINMYTDGAGLRGLKKLPLTLLDALRVMEKNKTVKEGFGAEAVKSYLKLKMTEWHAYTSHLSDWEREQTLDC